MKSKVAMIGLGAMGAPMAVNLHNSGWLAGVWNRTAAKGLQLLQQIDTTVYPDLESLARTSRFIIICVSADDDVLAVIDQLRPHLDGEHIVLDCSTVAPATAREAASRIETRGAQFLDAPVSGGVEGARNGKLVMMVGGDPRVLDAVRQVLDSISSKVEHMGPVGAGQATKAVNQLMAAGINQAVSESLAFGEFLGLDLNKLIKLLGGGAAGNWFLEHRGPTMIKNEFKPGFKLALHFKDLNICRDMLDDDSYPELELPTLSATLRDYSTLLEEGFGDEDISALYRLKRGMFNLHE